MNNLNLIKIQPFWVIIFLNFIVPKCLTACEKDSIPVDSLYMQLISGKIDTLKIKLNDVVSQKKVFNFYNSKIVISKKDVDKFLQSKINDSKFKMKRALRSLYSRNIQSEINLADTIVKTPALSFFQPLISEVLKNGKCEIILNGNELDSVRLTTFKTKPINESSTFRSVNVYLRVISDTGDIIIEYLIIHFDTF